MSSNLFSTECAIMVATVLTSMFDQIERTAISVAASDLKGGARLESVPKAMSDMIASGALEKVGEAGRIRFERLSEPLRSGIRLHQRAWGWQPGWSAVQQTGRFEGPSIALEQFEAQMQDTLRHLAQEGLVTFGNADGRRYVASADYLAAHPASVAPPYRPLATLHESMHSALLDDGAVEMRSGTPCVCWDAFTNYAPFAADPSDWELDGSERVI